MNDKPAAPVSAQTEPNFNPIVAISVPLPVDLIDPNPHQPRQEFDPARLGELAESIKAHGVIQPIVVQSDPAGDRFTLHDGERRLRAAKLAGLVEIPAYIVPPGMDARQLLLRAIVANDQRADLSPIERAKGYQKLADEHGLSDSDIARQVSKSRSLVANTRRLLQLPPERQAQIAAGELSERQAMALLSLYQLPQSVQEKLANVYHTKDLTDNPHKLTSDQIRDQLKRGLDYIAAGIKLFTPGEEMGGPGVRHSICTDCPFYLKVFSQDPRCTDGECNQAKRNEWKRRQLEQAKTLTGLNFADPGKKLPYGRYTDFFGSDMTIIEHAQTTGCPHLVLKCNEYESMSPRPEGVSGFIEYICLHPGKGDACLCKQTINADKIAKEKADKAANKQIKDAAAQAVGSLLIDTPLPVLKAVALFVGTYGDQEKIAANDDPAWLSKKVAGIMVSRKFYEYSSPEANQKHLTEWLKTMGLSLNGREVDKLAALDRRLSRIEDWLTNHPEQPPADQIKAIRGNLTNLAQIAEELTKLEAPKLTTRLDNAKHTLLIWLDQVEQQSAFTGEITSIKSSLNVIADWLANPRNHTAQKLLNRGQTAADLAYLVNTLIDKHGPQAELAALLTEIDVVESLCAALRRKLSDNGTTEPLPLETAQ